MNRKRKNSYFPLKTEKGVFGISYNEKGEVNQLLFPNQTESTQATKEKSLQIHQQTQKTLTDYFAGKRNSKIPKLDCHQGTLFQQKVWKILQTIPYGETRSYSWVAEQVGHPKAVRAVGTACGKNPIPIFIPCHRVLQSSGGLGGFAPGLNWKKSLLQLEQKHSR